MADDSKQRHEVMTRSLDSMVPEFWQAFERISQHLERTSDNTTLAPATPEETHTQPSDAPPARPANGERGGSSSHRLLRNLSPYKIQQFKFRQPQLRQRIHQEVHRRESQQEFSCWWEQSPQRLLTTAAPKSSPVKPQHQRKARGT
ncbi:hypothetical protein CRG98_017278 [Punica granatum]|uniref:Uncharacterized protein n=1 Tax=Punica granatum TaxID=22663 RepID=A0A2I0K137_PUNGR|nr:hypothetical protein CRG98_017278 [Punica granatum]